MKNVSSLLNASDRQDGYTAMVALTEKEYDILMAGFAEQGWTHYNNNLCAVCDLPEDHPDHNSKDPNIDHKFKGRCSICSLAVDVCINPEHCNEELPTRMVPFRETDFYAFGGAEHLPDGGKPLMGTITLYGKEATFIIAGQKDNPNPNEKWLLEIVPYNEDVDADNVYQRSASTRGQALRIYERMQESADNDVTDVVDVYGFTENP